ncbi:putative glutathione s-transferase protein [Fulvimarina pelagi HTCC2506]|uniref:Putative glutathione s-transferase protein n=2 Tax=Fulvimarina pelagi TaxID=217511 RepID=Q0G196_9HYPH|nr:glutathione S-transferase C-terminal domain-containing protein [Fulvimarina pelagi]EAU41185.1 putative glutathione s-transferase protein [Fulvimarina pelagi HTCC2506]BAT30804.1 putative glutathione s-transferase protein [Fulvimarina pelagi]
MIDFYYAPTPNGWKVAIMLEECGLDYELKLMDLHSGEQFEPEFLKISPNAKMPAIVDHDPPDGYGDEPVPVFESAAILFYLADKIGRFAPERSDRRAMKELDEWLFWQTGSQGPMAGQLSHFKNYAPDNERDYGFKRYLGEFDRNLGVLENRLADRSYIMGEDYSIADIQAFPWAFIAKPLGASLDDFPRVADWRGRIKQRPAVQRAIDLAKDKQNRGRHRVDNNDIIFNQSSKSLKPKQAEN